MDQTSRAIPNKQLVSGSAHALPWLDSAESLHVVGTCTVVRSIENNGIITGQWHRPGAVARMISVTVNFYVTDILVIYDNIS